MTIFYGTGKADRIVSWYGDSTLYGYSGDDILADGNTQISNDILIGGEGNDTLVSTDGEDILRGGEGNDTFYFQSGTIHAEVFGGKDYDLLYLEDTNGKIVEIIDNGKDDIIHIYDQNRNLLQTFETHDVEQYVF